MILCFSSDASVRAKRLGPNLGADALVCWGVRLPPKLLVFDLVLILGIRTETPCGLLT